MAVYGGEANVLAAELREWLGRLWHGRRLAGTLAVLTLVVLFVFWVATTPLPPAEAPPGDGDNAP
jgi:predicted MFS family arabinose efflux permease